MKTEFTLHQRAALNAQQIAQRRSYLGATLVTCVVLALLGGTFHVLELGSMRMKEMRSKAEIDLEKETDHIRGAGEEIFVHTEHEHSLKNVKSYTKAEAVELLKSDQWQALEVMLTVPAGPFMMGTNNKRTDAHNRPEHEVTLAAYQIDKFPVTNAEYARFVAATGHIPPLHWNKGRMSPGTELHPVTMVSYFNAESYAKWAGKRLPTEEEWEKAARGTDGRRWPWGQDMDTKRLNTYYTVGSTTRVGSYSRGVSPYGAMDMAGNVSEWVASDFLPYVNSKAEAIVFQAKEAQIPVTGAERSMRMAEFAVTKKKYKVMRGGSWKSDPFSNSTYHRNYAWPNAASDFFGFRLARDLDSE